MTHGSRPDRRSARGTSVGTRGAPPDGRLGDRRDVLGRRAAAPADDVDQAGGGELADDARHRLGGLVVLAEGVGQPGVRVGRDEAVGDAGELRDVGAQLTGAERAVEADRQGAGVAHGVPERLGHLPRERAAGGVGDRAGDHDRPAALVLLEQRLERVDRGLGVEGVEDRLDEEHVGAAVDEAAGLLEVGLDELVVGDVAGPGVVDVGGDGCRAVRRAERAQHPARPVGRALGHGVGLGARERRGGDVQLVGEVLQAVVGERDALRVEGVGLEEVGARLEVGAVHPADDLRLGDRQQVVVALLVVGVVGEPLPAVVGLGQAVPLDHRAHRPVEDEDALAQGGGQGGRGVGAVLRGHGRSLRVGSRARNQYAAFLT